MNPTELPVSNDGWGLAMYIISGMVIIMGVLFWQLIKAQNDKDKLAKDMQDSVKTLTAEFSALMGQVSERMRVGNDLMVEVKDRLGDVKEVIAHCTQKPKAGR